MENQMDAQTRKNTGDYNTGYYNTGDCNTGYYNTGDFNTGDFNAGNCNTGSFNAGHFNTVTPEDILVFNKPCKRSVWDSAQKPLFIYSVSTTYWVDESSMSDKDKRNNPNFHAMGGQLRKRTYHEAWKAAYDSASQEDKELLVQLPNFDPDVFFEITGIRV